MYLVQLTEEIDFTYIFDYKVRMFSSPKNYYLEAEIKEFSKEITEYLSDKEYSVIITISGSGNIYDEFKVFIELDKKEDAFILKLITGYKNDIDN